MASRTGTLKSVSVLRGEDDQAPGEAIVRNYAVQVQNDTASTVDGSADTLDIATLGAAIKSALGESKTITVVSVSLMRPALVGSTVYGASVAMSSTTLQIVPKTAAAWSANAVLPANSTATNRPYTVFVSALVS